MELNAIKTRIFSQPDAPSLNQSHVSAKPEPTSSNPKRATSTTPETALEVLKSKPSHDELIKVLQWLLNPHHALSSSSVTISPTPINFNLKIPTPLTSKIIQTLVNDIIHTYWPSDHPNAELNTHHDRLGSLLLECLRSVTGVRSLVTHLRDLIDRSRNPNPARDATRGVVQVNEQRLRPLITIVQVLEGVLRGDGYLMRVWRDLNGAAATGALTTNGVAYGVLGEGKKGVDVLWNECIVPLGLGRVVSAVAEAERTGAGLGGEQQSWVGDGEKFAGWLGRNVWYMVVQGGEDEVRVTALALGKGLKLGYVDTLLQATFADLIAGDERAVDKSRSLIDFLTGEEQRVILYAIIRILEKNYLYSVSGNRKEAGDNLVGAAAALLSSMIGDVSARKTIMIDWLVALSAEAVRQGHMAHRAVILALSTDIESLTAALSKALEFFGQQLFIERTPIFQQEINTQILLLLIGYVFRADTAVLGKISRSSIYLNAISNHLASTSTRVRFLGMVVGIAVSYLVDDQDKRMNFNSAETEGSDGQWYRTLTNLQDFFGHIKDLSRGSSSPKNLHEKLNSTMTVAVPLMNQKKPISEVPVKKGSKIVAIKDLNDASLESDMPTYAKPDSDPEDSDDDPDLVQRKKPMVPVYIRDLLAGLRDLENYDSHRVALSAASSLIRRKATFGSEITDNIEDLATLLTGLNDKYEMESFQRWRLQGMIALLVADPKRMGPWFAQAFYNGEYSISQRASVLTTLGLGAREIAGLGKEDEAMTGWSTEPQFPSKQLPENLHNHYSSLPPSLSINSISPKRTVTSSSSYSLTPIDELSTKVSQILLQPLAAQAADALTGPNALKIRTFSSRIAVHSRSPTPSSNPLAKILADAFFFPLIGRWASNRIVAYFPSTGAAETPTTTTSPFLLSHLLRTLALILHASGTTSPDLVRITSEFWHLLLSVRALAAELPVLEALLFAFLALLEVNIARDDRRVAEEHARELLETQAWVEGLLEGRIGGGGSEEDERVRMVAAGLLLRCREVVERWQRVLMGDLVSYTM